MKNIKKPHTHLYSHTVQIQAQELSTATEKLYCYIMVQNEGIFNDFSPRISHSRWEQQLRRAIDKFAMG